MKKLIFLLVLPLVLSFQQDKTKHIVIVAYREPEMMYGNVKQVIELRPDKIKSDELQLCPFDTTNFDKRGDPIETKLGIKNRHCMLITYSTKYDEHGKRSITIVDDGNKKIYRFDSNDHIVKSENHTTSSQLLDYDIYKYDSAGDIMESDHCRGPYGFGPYDSKPTKTKFECDLNGFLLSIGGLTYKYLSTDANGNWTKRIMIKDRNELDTIERKITYY